MYCILLYMICFGEELEIWVVLGLVCWMLEYLDVLGCLGMLGE